MPGNYGEIKATTAVMPSGSTTASGVFLGGYKDFALYIPVITDAVISFASPTASVNSGLSLWRNRLAVAYTATSLGGTGNMWLSRDDLTFLAGFNGLVHVSAAAAQAAARDFVWHLKG